MAGAEPSKHSAGGEEGEWVWELGAIQGREQGCSAEESQGLQEDHEEDLGACRQEKLWAVVADHNLCIVSMCSFKRSATALNGRLNVYHQAATLQTREKERKAHR